MCEEEARVEISSNVFMPVKLAAIVGSNGMHPAPVRQEQIEKFFPFRQFFHQQEAHLSFRGRQDGALVLGTDYGIDFPVAKALLFIDK
jgi:hypothetical protein